MKVSELKAKLEEVLQSRGDIEIRVRGVYDSTSDRLEVVPVEEGRPWEQEKLVLWTDLSPEVPQSPAVEPETE